jgi:NADH dehydrogenase
MATIGRRAAVLQTKKMTMKGWPAWVAWLFVHILFLIGFRNRVTVFVQWAWSYLTWQRGARLITGEVSAGLEPEGYPRAPAPAPGLPRVNPSADDTAKAHAAGSRAAEDQTGWMGGDRDQQPARK